MQNTEYERWYTYDVDAYLVANYPSMNMSTRRSICTLALEVLESEYIEEMVDEIVSDYAKERLGLSRKTEEDDS